MREKKITHPLYQIWANIKKKGHTLEPAWERDFELFVLDLGDKPYPGARLIQKHRGLGYTRENTIWSSPVIDKNPKVELPTAPFERMRWLRDNYLPKAAPAPQVTLKQLRDEHGLDYDPESDGVLANHRKVG